MTLILVINHKFRISPLFSLFQYISHLFRKKYSFPYFSKFSTLFSLNSRVFFTYFVFFVSSASHNARTGRPCCMALLYLFLLLPHLLRLCPRSLSFKVQNPFGSSL